MTQDIKDIAAMMGEQFANAVKLAEKSEAEEIGSIVFSFKDAFNIYLTKISEAGERRAKLMEQVEASYNEEVNAAAIYKHEVAALSERLETLKKAKLGTKVSDEAASQRARAGNNMGGVGTTAFERNVNVNQANDKAKL